MAKGRRSGAGRLVHGGRWRDEHEWPLARTRFTHLFSAGFRTAMWVAATLAAAGGALSYLTIRDDSVAAGLPPPRRLVPLAI